MDILNLTVPASWDELSQVQLDFVLRAISEVNSLNADRPFFSKDDYVFNTSAQVGLYCLLGFNSVRLVCPYADHWLVAHEDREFIVSVPDLTAAVSLLDWVRSLPEVPVRLDVVDGSNAVAADLDDGFSFDDWLSCESLWQGYQATHSDDFLLKMTEILYRKPDIKPQPFELLGVFYWWAGVKAECNSLYPNFFQPVSGEAKAPSQDDIRKSVNAQIRALTKGDITKESEILALPCHRALTELDALAREYEEINRKYPTNK